MIVLEARHSSQGFDTTPHAACDMLHDLAGVPSLLFIQLPTSGWSEQHKTAAVAFVDHPIQHRTGGKGSVRSHFQLTTRSACVPTGSAGDQPLRVTVVLDCAHCQPSALGAVLPKSPPGPRLG